MRIKKVITTGLDIHNVINVFTDKEANVLSILRNKYENRCTAACLIQKVTRIIRMGDCIINQFGDPSFGTMSVEFEVEALIFNQNEVIIGSKAVKNSDKILICENDVSSTFMLRNQRIESIKEGDVVPVMVTEVEYNIGASKAAVSGRLFTPNPTQNYYYIGSAFTADELEYARFYMEAAKKLAQQLESVIEEQSKSGDDVAGRVNFFKTIMRPYKLGAESAAKLGLAGGTSMTLGDIFAGKMAPGQAYISRDPRLDMSTDAVYVVKTPLANSNVMPKVDKRGVLIALITDYMEHLRVLTEFLIHYPNQEAVEKHQHIWRIIGRSRI